LKDTDSFPWAKLRTLRIGPLAILFGSIFPISDDLFSENNRAMHGFEQDAKLIENLTYFLIIYQITLSNDRNLIFDRELPSEIISNIFKRYQTQNKNPIRSARGNEIITS
jgi:hypothetical protein